jgi:hypothetical protein
MSAGGLFPNHALFFHRYPDIYLGLAEELIQGNLDKSLKNLSDVPCSLFPVPCSLFPIPTKRFFQHTLSKYTEKLAIPDLRVL